VGMFFAVDQPPLVPDVLLSLGVKVPADIRPKRHRSYFFWEYGKPPDALIEVVSNQEGGELGTKKDQYARIGIPLYVVWDPLALISATPLQAFGLRIKTYEALSPAWFDVVGLGLAVWHGTFEQLDADWLRWCDRGGQVIPLGEERAAQADQQAAQADQRAAQADQRAAQAEQRAARLAGQLRQLGIEPGNGNE
jgi:Putative restriction endonuclease